MPGEAKARLKTAERDVRSLKEHGGHLTQKASFLLDATLGLINLGGGVQPSTFRMSFLDGAVGGGVERPPQRRPIVEPVGHPRQVLQLGRQVG